MSATVRRRTDSDWRSCSIVAGPPLRHRRVCARRASRSSSARGDAGRGAGRPPRASTAAARSSRVPSAARIGPGSCRSRSPEPGSATSFATRRSTRLARELRRRARSSEPVSAANPTRTGRGASGRRVGCARGVEAVDDPADLGEDVGRRARARGSGASPRASFVVGRVARPEVGDGRGHDERVEGRPAVGARRAPPAGPPASRRSTPPGRRAASRAAARPHAAGDRA